VARGFAETGPNMSDYAASNNCKQQNHNQAII